MVATRLRGFALVATILSGLAGTSLLFHATSLGAASSAEDEFGRNVYASTCDSLLRSYLEAGGSALIAVAVPVFLGAMAAARNGRTLRVLAHVGARILDPVPLLLWLALIYSGLGVQGYAGRQIALTFVALPFTLGIVLDRLGEISALPFTRNAHACGIGLVRRLLWLIIPNGLSSFYFPVVVMFGLSLTFDAVLGLMGMANRSTLSLGTLLWRAKERVIIDDRLGLLAILALLATVVLFTGLRWMLAEESSALITPDPAIAADNG